MATSAAEKARMAMLAGIEEEETPDYFGREAAYQSKVDTEKEAKREKAKKMSGLIWTFMMPEKPNGEDNTRVASGRLLLPSIRNNIRVLIHQSSWTPSQKDFWKEYCPGTIGLQCKRCNEICKKHDMIREELLDDEHPEHLTEYASEKEWDYKTYWEYVWYFWHNEGNKLAGEVRLFAWPFNRTTPLKKLFNLNKLRVDDAIAKGKTPHYLNEYDIILIQEKEKAERVFDVHDDAIEPFAHWEEVEKQVKHALKMRNLKWDYVLSKTRDEDELVKLRKAAYEETGEVSFLGQMEEVKPKSKSSPNGKRAAPTVDDDKEEEAKPVRKVKKPVPVPVEEEEYEDDDDIEYDVDDDEEM